MAFSFRYFTYTTFIDPLVSGLHKEIVNALNLTDRVVDIGCGPGSLSALIAATAKDVIGIDIDEEMLGEAEKAAAGKGLSNVHFEKMDASDLGAFRDKEFDVAVTSMTIHQFEAGLAVQVLREMKRIAPRVIIADYNNPMPARLSKGLAWGIERLAGGDHYRNFRVYMERGGLDYFTREAGLSATGESVRGYGVLIIRHAKERELH